jgi:hypothetical protein
MRSWFIMAMALATLTAQGQVAGFLGKRFMVFADANPTPALAVQNINNVVIVNPGGDDARTTKENRFAYNIRPQATIEYLLGKNFGLGLSYSRLMMGTTRAYYTRPHAAEENLEYAIDLDVVKGQAAGLHLKWYMFSQSASPAPIGFYQMVSIYVTQTNTYDNKKATAKQFRDDFIYPVISMSAGRQNMIAKNLLIKAGFEMGWAFVPSNFMVDSESDWDAQDYSGYNVHRSLFGYYLFNIHIGVGYILF